MQALVRVYLSTNSHLEELEIRGGDQSMVVDPESAFSPIMFWIDDDVLVLEFEDIHGNHFQYEIAELENKNDSNIGEDQ